MGKHKAQYSRHLLVGDHVIVVNAAKIEVSGKASAMRNYYRHSGYVGNLKTTPMSEVLSKRPDRVIQRAVKGMLPGNRLGKRMLTRLRIYIGPEHKHYAQINASPPRPRRKPIRVLPPVPEARAVVPEEAPIVKPAAKSTPRKKVATKTQATIGKTRTPKAKTGSSE
jgi:ribosomal protein L13